MIIVMRKFSMLANLDVTTIQAEREAKFKEQIISNRLKRNYYKYTGKMIKVLRPVGFGIGNFFRWSYDKLVEFKENYNREKIDRQAGNQQKVNKLFIEAEDLFKDNDYNKAEGKYIEIISYDSKNYRAFKELGKLYFTRKDFNEAKQTYKHALKLLDYDGSESETGLNSNLENAATYCDLALVHKAINDFEGALVNINKALSFEPNNPKYLDTKVEISIIKKDKISALDGYDRLKEVNPDNNKLGDIKEQIDEL
jgi:tetratricopeptide (TPR) repeat protein